MNLIIMIIFLRVRNLKYTKIVNLKLKKFSCMGKKI